MPIDEEALCQGVGGGGKSLTTSRESGERGLCHQSRCRKSKHTHARASFTWAVFRFFSLFLPLLDFVIFSLHELLLSVSRSPPCVSSHHLRASIPAFHFAFCFVSLHFFFLLNPFILPSLVSVVPSALHSERPSSMPMLALTRQRSAGTTMQQNSRNTTRNRTTTITPTYRSSSM